jgi:hypothetical protein
MIPRRDHRYLVVTITGAIYRCDKPPATHTALFTRGRQPCPSCTLVGGQRWVAQQARILINSITPGRRGWPRRSG